MTSEASKPSAATIIAVQGEAYLEVAPERALAHLVIDVDGPERASVQDRAAEARNRCIAAIRSRHDTTAGPITEWAAGQLQVWSQRPWNADGVQLPLVFHSRSTIDATFSNLDEVGDVVDTLSATDGVTLTGLEWSVTDLTRQELEGRCQRDAVQNAVAKASVFASALGLGEIRPLELSEPSAFGGGGNDGSFSRMLMASSGGATEFIPEPIRIAVQVDVRFEARPAAS